MWESCTLIDPGEHKTYNRYDGDESRQALAKVLVPISELTLTSAPKTSEGGTPLWALSEPSPSSQPTCQRQSQALTYCKAAYVTFPVHKNKHSRAHKLHVLHNEGWRKMCHQMLIPRKEEGNRPHKEYYMILRNPLFSLIPAQIVKVEQSIIYLVVVFFWSTFNYIVLVIHIHKQINAYCKCKLIKCCNIKRM